MVLDFGVGDPVWNLRLREVAFFHLNPANRFLRAAGIFVPEARRDFQSTRGHIFQLTVIARRALELGLPMELAQWSPEDAEECVTAGRDLMRSTRERYVATLRLLCRYSDVLTGGGLPDPWPGKPNAKVAGIIRDVGVRTRPVPPQTWWPMIRNSWTYIHVFAPDLLKLRGHFEQRDRTLAAQACERRPRKNFRGAEVDQALDRWAADPDNRVLVYDRPFVNASANCAAGDIAWIPTSLVISGGRSEGMFGNASRPIELARRAVIEQMVAQGRTMPYDPREGRRQLERLGLVLVPRRTGLAAKDADALIRDWLSQEGCEIPVHGPSPHLARAAGQPNWSAIGRMACQALHGNAFLGPVGAARREMVYQAIANGTKVQVFDGKYGYWHFREDCSWFTEVERADGTRGPWRTRMSRSELEMEIRVLIAACYLFITGISLMRDSEVQEIVRGSVTTHYGSPAVVSRKIKNEESAPETHWWIIEQVAEAIAVLEQVSWHETHVFATARPPVETVEPGATKTVGRRGVEAASRIDEFFRRVEETWEESGLTRIPPAHVRPHMLRKTMSIIAAQEPDGDVALGLQLKHATTRALANRTTQAYWAADAAWAKEFDSQYQIAAAERLIELLRARQSGQAVAVGPGATRLHQGLDAVAAKASHDPALRAQVGDARLLAELLRGEFPELHWGTVNHCLWNAPTAECQNALPEDQRGQAPLIGACQPARCRNSTVTAKHMPVWLGEEADLMAMLRERRLSPPRRESLKNRLADVRLVTDAWRREHPETEEE